MALPILEPDWLTRVIERGADIEDVQHGRDVNEQRREREVPTGTEPDSTRRRMNTSATAARDDESDETHLLPKPKLNAFGSRAEGSSFPSCMKRSGRNSSGHS